MTSAIVPTPLTVAAQIGMRRVAERMDTLSRTDQRRRDVRAKGYFGPLTRNELARTVSNA